jgi:hypothetical protein
MPEGPYPSQLLLGELLVPLEVIRPIHAQQIEEAQNCQ